MSPVATSLWGVDGPGGSGHDSFTRPVTWAELEDLTWADLDPKWTWADMGGDRS